jgi:nucleoside-diphosphate-sugar epimerase
VHRINDDMWPSSPYGAAKVLGEALARLHVVQHGLAAVVLRIGWLIAEDDPRAVGDKERAFMRGLYLSHRDAGEIFSRAVTMPLPSPPFLAAYATSHNGRSMLDVATSERVLGYASQDDAERFY